MVEKDYEIGCYRGSGVKLFSCKVFEFFSRSQNGGPRKNFQKNFASTYGGVSSSTIYTCSLKTDRFVLSISMYPQLHASSKTGLCLSTQKLHSPVQSYNHPTTREDRYAHLIPWLAPPSYSMVSTPFYRANDEHRLKLAARQSNSVY